VRLAEDAKSALAVFRLSSTLETPERLLLQPTRVKPKKIEVAIAQTFLTAIIDSPRK
jgi:hypothetical protein